jgi:hypothetical protein
MTATLSEKDGDQRRILGWRQRSHPPFSLKKAGCRRQVYRISCQGAKPPPKIYVIFTDQRAAIVYTLHGYQSGLRHNFQSRQTLRSAQIKNNQISVV